MFREKFHLGTFATEQDATLLKGTERVSRWCKNGEVKKTPRSTRPLAYELRLKDAPTISEEVVEQAQDQIEPNKAKELDKPTLTLTQVDKEELKRSATYRLDKPDGVTIKSIQTVLKYVLAIGRGENPDPFRDGLGSCFSDLTNTRIIRSQRPLFMTVENGDEKKCS